MELLLDVLMFGFCEQNNKCKPAPGKSNSTNENKYKNKKTILPLALKILRRTKLSKPRAELQKLASSVGLDPSLEHVSRQLPQVLSLQTAASGQESATSV